MNNVTIITFDMVSFETNEEQFVDAVPFSALLNPILEVILQLAFVNNKEMVTGLLSSVEGHYRYNHVEK